MGRTVVGVVVGYITMMAGVFVTFSAAYLGMGQERAFRPESYEPSDLWLGVSFALAFVAAIVGGFVCVWISRSNKAPLALAVLVVVVGFLFAIPAFTDSTPAEVRTGEVSNLDAMQKARQPAWVGLVNPLLGAVGVLVGARLRRVPTIA